MHVCQSGCRVLLGMMSTSEPTFSTASAASERSSCILISFQHRCLHISIKCIHLHRDQSLDRARLIMLVV